MALGQMLDESGMPIGEQEPEIPELDPSHLLTNPSQLPLGHGGEDGNTGTETGHSDSPRELHPNAQPALDVARAPYAAQPTPLPPDAPTPVAGQPHGPTFQPMPPPMLPAGAAPTANRGLFGRAGGLLGGGLGVPGVLGDEGHNSDEDAFYNLLKYMASGRS